MHFELLVEERSAEAALTNLLPRILGPNHTFAIHPFEGKPDLLSKLPSRLRGYTHGLPPDWRIVVLVDKDADDCHDLKTELENAASQAGLQTRTAARGARLYQVLSRLVIEELESWFFGDADALLGAYPRLPQTLRTSPRYRRPDDLSGPREILEHALKHARYYRTGVPRIEMARLISEHMDPARNRSRSFRVFADGLEGLVEQ